MLSQPLVNYVVEKPPRECQPAEDEITWNVKDVDCRCGTRTCSLCQELKGLKDMRWTRPKRGRPWSIKPKHGDTPMWSSSFPDLENYVVEKAEPLRQGTTPLKTG